MKTVYLLRHAKSSWDDPALDDTQRPLNPRGEEAAQKIGRYMAIKGYRPQLVLLSPSLRTRQTWELVSHELGHDIDVRRPAWLYLANPQELAAAIRRSDDSFDAIMIVGHNPGLAHFAKNLASKSDPSRAQIADKFPTGALAVLDFSADTWLEVARGLGRIRDFVRPKQL